MSRKSRGWIMLEADITSMLELIEERIRSRTREIDVRHRDALIRLRTILEHDLNTDRSDVPEEKVMDHEAAA
jgi:hypothetical protein